MNGSSLALILLIFEIACSVTFAAFLLPLKQRSSPIRQYSPIQQDTRKDSWFLRLSQCLENEKDSSESSPRQFRNEIFVGGLPYKIKDGDLKRFFEQFGAVTDSSVAIDQVTKRSRGFGFVSFENGTGGAQKAIEAQPIKIHGRLVGVRLSNGKQRAIKTHPFENRRQQQQPFKVATVKNKIFVGGLSPQIDGDTLKQIFEQFGAVTNAFVSIDKSQNMSRGFGFVTFEDGTDGAQKAVAAQPIDIDGCNARIQFATPPKGEQSAHRELTNRFDINKEVNQKIVQLGRKRDWRGILDLFEARHEVFDNVNYSTALNQLGRISATGTKIDPRLVNLLESLGQKINENGFEWLGVRQFSNSIHAIAKLNLGKINCTDTIFEQLDKQEFVQWLVRNGNPQSVANSAWACGKLGIQSPLLFAELENSAKWLVEKGEPQAVANCVWACGKLGVKSPSLFAEMENSAKWLAENGGPQSIANCVWACGKLGVHSPSLFAELESNAQGMVTNGKPQSIANGVWACATLGVESPLLFAELEQNAKWLVKKGTPQDIANSVWACGALGVKAPLLFAELEENAEWLVEKGNPQDVANSVWACAKLGVESPFLFAELERKAIWFVENGDAQDISNSVWACGKLGMESPTLFSELNDNSIWLVANCKPQATANSVWACGTLGVECPWLFEELEDNAKWFVEKGTPQDVANSVWACAKLGVESPSLFTEVENKAEWLLDNGKPQDIANIAWACAKLGVQSPALFAELERNAKWLVARGSPQDIANSVWACGKLGLDSPSLFAEMERNVIWVKEKGKHSDIKNIRWACEELGLKSPI